MPRTKKVENPEVVETSVQDKVIENAEPKHYVVNTKQGYALNVRNLKDDSVSRIIANETPISVVKIEGNKAILNDTEYVIKDLIKEEV